MSSTLDSRALELYKELATMQQGQVATLLKEGGFLTNKPETLLFLLNNVERTMEITKELNQIEQEKNPPNISKQ